MSDVKLYTKVAGEFKSGVPYVKVFGTWLPAKACYIKVNGKWQLSKT